MSGICEKSVPILPMASCQSLRQRDVFFCSITDTLLAAVSLKRRKSSEANPTQNSNAPIAGTTKPVRKYIPLPWEKSPTHIARRDQTKPGRTWAPRGAPVGGDNRNEKVNGKVVRQGTNAPLLFFTRDKPADMFHDSESPQRRPYVEIRTCRPRRKTLRTHEQGKEERASGSSEKHDWVGSPGSVSAWWMMKCTMRTKGTRTNKTSLDRTRRLLVTFTRCLLRDGAIHDAARCRVSTDVRLTKIASLGR